MTAARSLWWTILALWIVTVLGHLAGAVLLPDQLWGMHLYRFVAPPVVIGGVLLAVVAGVLLFKDPGSLPSASVPRRFAPFLEAGAAAAAFVVFWAFRVRHLLLGDSYVLVQSVPAGASLHPREPLTAFLHESLYRALRHLPLLRAMPKPDAAWWTVALESALCGALFLIVAVRLAREIVRSTSGGASPALIALILMAQGYALLFFGYVENYTYLLLATGVYLLLSLRYSNGRGSLLAPAIALILAFWLHLSALALAPSFVVLAAWGLRCGDTRRKALRDLLVAAALLAVSLMIPSLLGSRLSGGAMVRSILREAWQGHRTGAGIPYMVSGRHVRDFCSEQFLVGPLGMLLLLPAAVMALVRGAWRKATPLFLLAAALPPLLGAWMASDPNLGYPRDWDVFAPLALTFTAAGLGLFLPSKLAESSARRGPDRWLRRALLCAVVLSLFHLVPWVALNASEERALERTQHLPMGYGRAQVVVGRYYLERKMYPLAESWFRKSLEEFPQNVNAYQLLGSMYAEQGAWEKAARAYELALRLRPDKLEFHDQRARALVRIGRYEEAEKDLRYVAEQMRDDANAWKALGIVLQQLGRSDSAQAAFDRADRYRESAGDSTAGPSPRP
jgi:tetratricopeptide (TPR) repeat protein